MQGLRAVCLRPADTSEAHRRLMWQHAVCQHTSRMPHARWQWQTTFAAKGHQPSQISTFGRIALLNTYRSAARQQLLVLSDDVACHCAAA